MSAIVIIALPAFRLAGGRDAAVPHDWSSQAVTLEPGTAITIEAVDDTYARVSTGGAWFAVVAVDLASSVTVTGR